MSDYRMGPEEQEWVAKRIAWSWLERREAIAKASTQSYRVLQTDAAWEATTAMAWAMGLVDTQHKVYLDLLELDTAQEVPWLDDPQHSGRERYTKLVAAVRARYFGNL